MVVHCSGGVGRSGTFVSIYSLYRMLEECRVDGDSAPLEKYNWLDGGREVTLVNVVGQLRQQRHPWMVEGMSAIAMNLGNIHLNNNMLLRNIY